MNVRRILLSLCMVVIAGVGLAQSSHRKFELMKLPYALNALEPVISAETLSLHHGKHLNTYVNNLNKLIAGTKFEQMELEEIVATSEGALFNNAGQTLNHNLYFTQFSPEGGGTPVGNLSVPLMPNGETLISLKKNLLKAPLHYLVQDGYGFRKMHPVSFISPKKPMVEIRLPTD